MDAEQRTTAARAIVHVISRSSEADRARLVKASVASWAGANRKAQQRAVDHAWEIVDRPAIHRARWDLEAELEAALGVVAGHDIDRLTTIDRIALDVAAETLWAELAAGDLPDDERELLLEPWRVTFG
jgi:hypothetical protein